MKIICSLLFMAPLVLLAQDCKLKKEIDPFSQQPRLTTGFFGLGSDRLSITADSKEIDFFFVVGGNKCFDDQTTVTIHFDGDRLRSNFRASGTMNCEGLYHFSIRNTATPNFALQRLATKKVASVKFVSGKTTADITLNETQKQELLERAACMMEQAKTLIK